HLRVSSRREASPGRTRQDADPTRRGSDPRVSPVGIRPTIPACVAEPVSRLAATPDRLCARRSVVLPSDGTASTDARRGPCNQGHVPRARVPPRPDRPARRPGPAARQGRAPALTLVPPRPAAWLAPSPPPRASGETEDRASHDARQ